MYLNFAHREGANRHGNSRSSGARRPRLTREGVSLEVFLAAFGAPMPPRKVGDNVVSILTDPRYATGVAFCMKGDLGIVSLDA